MKIGFIVTMPVVEPNNGIKMQAINWKVGLEELGHEVKLINLWENNDWKQFDIVHLFGLGDLLYPLTKKIYNFNRNIVISPIVDPLPHMRPWMYKILAHWGSRKLRLRNNILCLREASVFAKMISARSEFEKQYLSAIVGDSEKIQITPLSTRFLDNPIPPALEKKEDFCLHVSLLADTRKNVTRLIQAAKKYDFRLVLAGKLRNEQERNWLEREIDGARNIEYEGFLADEELRALYAKAKVFALPSIYEGVGLVALEAASLGCNIVLTTQGGPKEYYDGRAELVNPYSIDDIGQAVLRALKDNASQPELSVHISRQYSPEKTMTDLVDKYAALVNKNNF